MIGWWQLSLLLPLMLCAGCETVVSNHVVPPVILYEPEVQERAADELEQLGPPCARDTVYPGCSAVHRFVIDYQLMRDQIRAVKGAEAE